MGVQTFPTETRGDFHFYVRVYMSLSTHTSHCSWRKATEGSREAAASRCHEGGKQPDIVLTGLCGTESEQSRLQHGAASSSPSSRELPEHPPGKAAGQALLSFPSHNLAADV